MCVCVCGGEGRERSAARLWQVFWLHVSCCRFDVILYLHFVNAWAVERGELWRVACVGLRPRAGAHVCVCVWRGGEGALGGTFVASVLVACVMLPFRCHFVFAFCEYGESVA